ncbi:MAG: NAD(P)-dependent oxidoreductase [Rhodospirillales bacterium]|jgi:3-hydroxyisobutyrate dehydrogenase|nr:NAD(P)-dependent oxidoreductase [Rhodospirillales bacterium]MDP6804171.1 NAD(P)-dependent oxidoreductase [Rhodospirillales bacterium]
MAEHDVRLGFIGLGLMGLPMTIRLLDADFAVTVWNRTPKKTSPAVEKGARLAASPAEVAEASDIVFTCILDTGGMEQVVFGPGGVAEGARPGTLLVDFSTIAPSAMKAMAATLRADKGVRWVDAPVTGGVWGASEGALVIMAGGEEADVDEARPALAPMAKKIVHMGPLGAGLLTKLCNQLVIGCSRVVMAEMISFARGAGLDPAALPGVLEGGLAESKLLHIDVPFMLARDFSPRGQSKNLNKDLDIIRDVARAGGTSLPMTGLATELWRMHVARGYGDNDGVSIITMFET